MKRRMIAVTLALLLLMTIVPVTAAAADGNGQPIPVEVPELIYQEQSPSIIPVEVTDQDPVVWENYRGKIYEFTLPQAGTLILRLSPFKGSSATETVFSNSKNLSKTNGHWNTQVGWSDSSVDTGTRLSESGKAGEKFYLAVTNDANSFKSTTSLRAAFYPAADRTIEFGKTYVFGGEKSKKNYDFKFTALKSGFMSVDDFSAGDNDTVFCLLDQNKKRISEQYKRPYDQRWRMRFGVQKGKTYYLRATLDRPHRWHLPHSIRLMNYAVEEKSGASRKKAVLLKKKERVKGYILPGKKTSDWYKIKVTKKKKISILIKNRFSSRCYFDIYDKKGKKLKTKQFIGGNSIDPVYVDDVNHMYARLAKGTYYIKIYNKTKGNSGGYLLMWK